MPIAAKSLFFVSMDVKVDPLELFHEVYEEEHIPNLLTVPGVHSVTRVAGEDFAVSIGGERKQVTHRTDLHGDLRTGRPVCAHKRSVGDCRGIEPPGHRGASVPFRRHTLYKVS